MIKFIKILIIIVSLLLAFALGVTFSDSVNSIVYKGSTGDKIEVKQPEVPGANSIIIEDVTTTTTTPTDENSIIPEDNENNTIMDNNTIEDGLIGTDSVEMNTENGIIPQDGAAEGVSPEALNNAQQDGTAIPSQPTAPVPAAPNNTPNAPVAPVNQVAPAVSADTTEQAPAKAPVNK